MGGWRGSTGATIHIHELAEAEYAHEPFADGWVLELGDLTIEAIHTPGHRPEHTSFLLARRQPRRRPLGAARRRLAVHRRRRPPRPGGRAARGRAEMFRSLHERLLSARRRGRDLAGPPRRLALRRLRDRPQDLLDDRLRARATTRALAIAERGRVRRGRGRLAGRPAAERRADRRRSTAGRWSRTSARRRR